MVNVSTKLLLEKNAKNEHKNYNKNHDSVQNLWQILGTKFFFVDFWDHIFKQVKDVYKHV